MGQKNTDMSEPFKMSHATGALSGKVSWRSPSNIALIKYWGKREGQLPSNPSLSLTLSQAFTESTIEYEFIEALTSPEIHFSFSNASESSFEERISGYIKNLIFDIPFISQVRMNIQSHNTFPHSAGIASSASAFSALALCLCSIEKQLNGAVSGTMDFYQKASYLARLGSGSACRSVYGGYVIWGETGDYTDSSNLYGVPFPYEVHPLLTDMHDSILVVSSARKTVSSSAGHQLMKYHPYASARYQQARDNMLSIIRIIQSGDMDGFVKIVENEAMSLHALMMSSSDSFILLQPATLSVIEKVKDYRRRSGIPVCFTLDAGPNIHMIYPAIYKDKIHEFIQSELVQFCEGGRVIHDFIGDGPKQLI